MIRVMLVFVLLLCSPCLIAAELRWFKGDTHAHTSRSGTQTAPEQVAAWYRQHGYSFVFITDYNATTPVDSIDAAQGVIGSFRVFPGMELTDKLPHRPVHLTALGVARAVPAQGGSGVAELVDADAHAITEAGGLPILNHPNGYLPGALRLEELLSVHGVSLMEICCADYLGGSGHPSIEQLWDGLLSAGRVIYGVAADDAHDFNPEAHQAGTAWIAVLSESLDLPHILEALRAGRFYASTGIELTAVRADSEELCLQPKNDGDYGFRTVFIGAGGKALKTDESDSPCYRYNGKEIYVRARVERSDGALAWVQPVFLRLGNVGL